MVYGTYHHEAWVVTLVGSESMVHDIDQGSLNVALL